jgi:hypothetical protein
MTANDQRLPIFLMRGLLEKLHAYRNEHQKRAGGECECELCENAEVAFSLIEQKPLPAWVLACHAKRMEQISDNQ